MSLLPSPKKSSSCRSGFESRPRSQVLEALGRDDHPDVEGEQGRVTEKYTGGGE